MSPKPSVCENEGAFVRARGRCRAGNSCVHLSFICCAHCPRTQERGGLRMVLQRGRVRSILI